MGKPDEQAIRNAMVAAVRRVLVADRSMPLAEAKVKAEELASAMLRAVADAAGEDVVRLARAAESNAYLRFYHQHKFAMVRNPQMQDEAKLYAMREAVGVILTTEATGARGR